MKQEPQIYTRRDGSQLMAYLIKENCKVGPQVKELWKVDSPIFHNVCHMCCYQHRKCGCTWLSFGAERPCWKYNKRFGYTHFFQELQRPQQTQQHSSTSILRRYAYSISRFFHRKWLRKKARQ